MKNSITGHVVKSAKYVFEIILEKSLENTFWMENVENEFGVARPIISIHAFTAYGIYVIFFSCFDLYMEVVSYGCSGYDGRHFNIFIYEILPNLVTHTYLFVELLAED